MKNPIVSAREALGLSRTEMALRMGCNYQSLTRIELGHPAFLAEVWRDRFAEVGIEDFGSLATKYVAWRKDVAVAPRAAEG